MRLLTAQLRARIEAMVLDAISRLPPNITPSDPRFLEWIESLIRYRTREPLDPTEKPPVLGGIGIADKHVRGSMGESFLLMDSGWIAIDPTWLAANPSAYPLGIYLGDSDMAYLAEGTMVPQGEPPNQWLIPSATYHDERLDWPSVPPVATMQAGSHVYDSPIITDGGALPGWTVKDPIHGENIQLTASLYTGLLRLAEQAKIGAGFSPLDLLWELDTPNSYSASSGLIHNEDYEFYKIAVESDGAFARKLKNSFATDWIVTEFIDNNLGSPGDVSYRMFMAWLLMDLSVDTEEEEFELLSSVALTDVYGGRQPLKHGWHWNRSAPFKGSVVTVQEQDVGGIWWIECTLAQINISFVEGVPEMELILDVEDEKAGPKPLLPVWVEKRYSNGGVDPVVPPLGRSIAEEGDNTAVYCFYDDNNDLQKLTWTAENESEEEASHSDCKACGLIQAGLQDWYGANTWKQGGWSMGGVFDYANDGVHIGIGGAAYGIRVDTQNGRVDRTEFVMYGPYPGPPGPKVAHSQCPCGPSQPQVYPDLDPGCSEQGNLVKMKLGGLDQTSTEEQETIADWRNFAIIPADDAESVIIGKAKERTHAKKYWEWQALCNQQLVFEPIVHYWNCGDGWYDIGPLPEFHMPMLPCYRASGRLPGSESRGDPGTLKEFLPYAIRNETVVYTIRSSGEPVDANQDYDGDSNDFYDDWIAAYQADLVTPHEHWNTPTEGSFAGHGIIYSETPSEGVADGRKMEGGYPALDHEDLHETTHFWSGWV